MKPEGLVLKEEADATYKELRRTQSALARCTNKDKRVTLKMKVAGLERDLSALQKKAKGLFGE